MSSEQVFLTTLTSGKGMTGVETNPDPRLVLNPVDNPTQLQKASANCPSLTSHVLQYCNALQGYFIKKIT